MACTVDVTGADYVFGWVYRMDMDMSMDNGNAVNALIGTKLERIAR